MENSFRTKTGEDRFTDPWFAKYNKATEGYVTADGNTIHFPFWLHSDEFMVYGRRRRALGEFVENSTNQSSSAAIL